LSSQKENFI